MSETTICLIILGMLMSAVVGGLVGWTARGWHEAEIEIGAREGVRKGLEK